MREISSGLDFNVDGFEEIIEAFRLLDQDNDGYITVSDIYYGMAVFENRDVTKRELEAIIKKYLSLDDNSDEASHDANKMVSIEDFFIFLVRNFLDVKDETVANILFNNLTENKRDYIDEATLKALLFRSNMSDTDEEIAEMIKIADCDNDGKISYEDFTKFLETLSFIQIDGLNKELKAVRETIQQETIEMEEVKY